MTDVEQRGILEGLKHRSVIRVGAMYVVAAWVLLQVADVLSEPLAFPDWIQTTLIGLLAIGLPITLLLAWVFDVTPEGIVRSTEDSRLELERLRKSHKIDYAIIGMLIVALALSYLREPQQIDAVQNTPAITTQPAVSLEQESSIAVLPFVNMSNDPDNEYFSDGISEEILNSLVRTDTLPVIARTSSFYFKNLNRTAKQIAEELQVTHILEGSVRKVGERVRITAQLIVADSGIHLWSESYDRKLIDVFAVQDEIATSIVNAIQQQFGENPDQLEQTSASRDRGTSNLMAYDLFLKANAQQEILRPASLVESIRLYRAALELDPDYVDAWNGLGYSYLWQTSPAILGGIPAALYPAIEATARKALSIQPNSARAMGFLGYALAMGKFEWRNGIQLMSDALRLNPRDAEIMGWYSYLLQSTSRVSWRAAADRAYRVDPLAPVTIALKSLELLVAGRPNDAYALTRNYLTHNPGHYYINQIQVTNAYYVDDGFKSFVLAHEAAKAVCGADSAFLGSWDLLFLERTEGDLELNNSLYEELKTRSKLESVYWVTIQNYPAARQPAILKILANQLQQGLIQSLLSPRPDSIGKEEWEDLRARFNVAELENGDYLPYNWPGQ